MKNCLIFAGGDFINYKNENNSFVICADSGYLNAVKNKIKPDLIIGDFDSYKDNLPNDIKIIRLPEIKDDTDLFYCVKEAIRLNFKDVTLISCIGDRQDHNIAAYSSLLYLKEHGANAKIVAKNLIAFILENESTEIDKNVNYKYLSIIPIGKKASKISVSGVKYPLNNAELTFNYPLGISNEIIENKAQVAVLDGTVLIMQTN